MNNSLHRILDGIAEALREDVIPRIEDAHARRQAVGIVDLLNNLRPRVDWARAPLQAEISQLHEAARDVEARFASEAEQPPKPPLGLPPALGPTPQDLFELRQALEEHASELVRWLAARTPTSELARAAEIMLRKALHTNLQREMKLIKKPLFGQTAADKSSEGGNRASEDRHGQA